MLASITNTSISTIFTIASIAITIVVIIVVILISTIILVIAVGIVLTFCYNCRDYYQRVDEFRNCSAIRSTFFSCIPVPDSTIQFLHLAPEVLIIQYYSDDYISVIVLVIRLIYDCLQTQAPIFLNPNLKKISRNNCTEYG